MWRLSRLRRGHDGAHGPNGPHGPHGPDGPNGPNGPNEPNGPTGRQFKEQCTNTDLGRFEAESASALRVVTKFNGPAESRAELDVSRLAK
mmetsp:Transcript_3811/g.9082  ORF Transcript_3811/g.9082 Transcript_3811/m.9082 type:complete len:90 (-) Transcript_3811:57-326(-)